MDEARLAKPQSAWSIIRNVLANAPASVRHTAWLILAGWIALVSLQALDSSDTPGVFGIAEFAQEGGTTQQTNDLHDPRPARHPLDLPVDYDPTLRSDTTTTAGIAGAAGLVLSRRFSVRVEFDVPRWHTSLHSRRTVRPQRIEEYEVREDGRAPGVSVLAGYHLRPSSGVEVVLLGGGTRTTRQARLVGYERKLNLDGSLIEQRDIDHRLDDGAWAAVTGGAEVALSLGRHLAIVPQLRVHSYFYFFSVDPSLIFVRPRIVARLRF